MSESDFKRMFRAAAFVWYAAQRKREATPTQGTAENAEDRFDELYALAAPNERTPR